MYFPTKKTYFVEVPRTGSSFVMQFMSTLFPARQPFTTIPASRHCPRFMVTEHVEFSFGCVRNPYTWYPSFYAFVQEYCDGRANAWELGKWHPCRVLEDLDYSTFDKWMADVVKWQPGFCTRLYELMLGPKSSKTVDSIMRFETLTEDLSELLKSRWKRKVTAAAIERLPKVNATSQEIDSGRWKAVIHAMDVPTFDRFGYDK